MRWHLALGWRLLKGTQRRWSSTFITAMISVTIGVAALVVAMAVISGFEATLRAAVIDTTGDMVVMDRSRGLSRWENLAERIKKLAPRIEASSPFLLLEAVATNDGRLAGVALQGVDPESVGEVLNLEPRLIRGEMSFTAEGDVYSAAIGRGLASNLNLEVGDRFRVVFPQPDPYDSDRMTRKLLTLEVAGILSLGKYDYDERQIITHIGALQTLMDNSNAYTGLIVKLDDPNQARDTAQYLMAELGQGYWVRSWRDVEQSLFEAVQIEKTILFFVVLIIVLAAAVNVSTAVNVNVIQRYSDIAVLKSLGVSSKQIWRLLSMQGAAIGGFGLIMGYALGLVICLIVEWLQGRWIVLPQDVYNIDKIFVVFRWEDALAIVTATLLVCFLSAALPARRGANLRPVEGLRYE